MSRNDLTLEQKVNLIKENERGSSYRQLTNKYNVSIGSVSNILKRKSEYLDDYECNQNKKVKRKSTNPFTQTLNDNVYEWFSQQRAKQIPISGTILQEYARKVAGELGDSGDFRASNGWLNRFHVRNNIRFRVISSEAASVSTETVEDWISRLPVILDGYDPKDVYNCDETGLFFKLMPDRSLVLGEEACKGGKRSKERYTVLLCTNWSGSHRLKPMVIGKSARPRCFKRLNMKKLPVTWCSNRTAWMNSTIFTKWLRDFDDLMGKENRKVLLFLDNAPVHPPDVELKNITMKFFPPNTTSKIQPLDQGLIKVFKTFYRKQLVQHLIANASLAHSVEEIVVSALDAIWWIDIAWKSISETTIQNVFKAAGFTTTSCGLNAPATTTGTNAGQHVGEEISSLVELDKALKHITIGGDIMSASDFVNIDDDVPSFNIWDDNSERILIADGFDNEDKDDGEEESADLNKAPTLAEVLQITRRLYLFSHVQHPEMHSQVVNLQNKLMKIYLDGNHSRQKTIVEYFQRI